MILNCSNEKGRLISARIAKLRLFNQFDTIENIYKNAVQKDGIHIENVILPLEESKHFYEYLWYLYLKQNKIVLNRILTCDSYIDGNEKGDIDSTARIFLLLKHSGLAGLKANIKSFSNKINQITPSITPGSITYYDKTAKLFYRNYQHLSRDDIITKVINSFSEPDQQTIIGIVDILCDIHDKTATKQYVTEQLNRIWANIVRIPEEKNNIIEV